MLNLETAKLNIPERSRYFEKIKEQPGFLVETTPTLIYF